MTGIEPALSAWELACHARSDHEFAGRRRCGPCPLLTALPRWWPPDRARSGHASSHRELSSDCPRVLLLPLLIRYAFCNRPVRPSDCQSSLVGGGRAILKAFPLWCSRLHTRRPHADRSIVELILSHGFMSEGDLIAPSETAQSVSHDIGEMHPASARGVCGVDHSKASVSVPRSDRSTAHAVITSHNARW